jgi:hypothetical protein
MADEYVVNGLVKRRAEPLRARRATTTRRPGERCSLRRRSLRSSARFSCRPPCSYCKC